MRRTIDAGEDFLSSAFQYPELKTKLQHGVKLDELRQIKQWLEDHRNEAYLSKEYGYLLADLEFLNDTKSLGPPTAPAGAYVTVRRHWVAIRGYFDVDSGFLDQEGMQSRWIVNTMSVKAQILTLDAEAYAIYKCLAKVAPRNTPTSALLQLLVYILHTHHETGGVDESYVKYVMRTYGYDVQDAALKSAENLAGAQRLQDEDAVVPRLMRSDYCVPSRTCHVYDGWFHFLTLPTWTLSALGSVDYSGNYIDGWDFFVVGDE